MHKRKRGNKRTAQERAKHTSSRCWACAFLGPHTSAHGTPPLHSLKHLHPLGLLSSPPYTLSSRLERSPGLALSPAQAPSQSHSTCSSQHPLCHQGHYSPECQSLSSIQAGLWLVHVSTPCGPQNRALSSFPDCQPPSTTPSSPATSHSCLQVPVTQKHSSQVFAVSYRYSLLQMLFFPHPYVKTLFKPKGEKAEKQAIFIRTSITSNTCLRKVPPN